MITCVVIDRVLSESPSTPCSQITVLQLSTLLKQADSSKRKLTLTRLASAPVPFTVLSLTGNPCNEDYLAVCGLKVRIHRFIVIVFMKRSLQSPQEM